MNRNCIRRRSSSAAASIVEQPPVVVPFAEHHVPARVLDEFFEAAFEQFGLLPLDLDGVDSDALVERRKALEVFPDGLVGLQCAQYAAVDCEAGRRHIGKDGAARVGHSSELFQTAATLLVQLAPCGMRPARREPLRGNAAFKTLHGAVNPAEAERLFHRVDVPERAVVMRPPALYGDPTFARTVMMFGKPEPQLDSVLGAQVY